jgi:hypothetical protein
MGERELGGENKGRRKDGRKRQRGDSTEGAGESKCEGTVLRWGERRENDIK